MPGEIERVEQAMKQMITLCQKDAQSEPAADTIRQGDSRYQQLFHTAPIAMIERDASLLKVYLDQLQASGISNLREFLEHNPQQVRHCWSLIKTIDYNRAFLELIGRTDGIKPGDVFFPTDSQEFLKLACEIILTVAEGRRANERELPILTASGERKVILGKALVVSDHGDKYTRVVVALVDVTERKKAEEVLRVNERRYRDLAFRDDLTGLYNQRFLYRSLDRLIESAETDGTPISLIFMDLDHFKRIVDKHGHLNGSQTIRKVAQTIVTCLKPPEYAVAYAGDEFVVVLPGMDQRQAVLKASQIRSQVKDTVYVLDQDVEVRLQASFGVASFPQNATGLTELLAAADQALFDIKDAGKDAIGNFQQR